MELSPAKQRTALWLLMLYELGIVLNASTPDASSPVCCQLLDRAFLDAAATLNGGALLGIWRHNAQRWLLDPVRICETFRPESMIGVNRALSWSHQLFATAASRLRCQAGRTLREEVESAPPPK